MGSPRRRCAPCRSAGSVIEGRVRRRDQFTLGVVLPHHRAVGVERLAQPPAAPDLVGRGRGAAAGGLGDRRPPAAPVIGEGGLVARDAVADAGKAVLGLNAGISRFRLLDVMHALLKFHKTFCYYHRH